MEIIILDNWKTSAEFSLNYATVSRPFKFTNKIADRHTKQ